MDKTGYDTPEKGKYSMLCHSMGCYFAAHWAKKYYEKLDQLFFMSPCGLKGPPENFSARQWISEYRSCVKRTLFHIANWVWGRHWSPGIAFKLPGYYGALALHKGWMERIKNQEPVTRSCFSKLLMESCL